MNIDFQDALDAFKRDDCETAYKIFLRLAEHDDPKAQFFLGALYFVGKESNKITVKPKVGTDLQQNRGLRMHNANWVKCYPKD